LDFFPRDKLKPNNECSNSWCLKRQAEYNERIKNQPVKQEVEQKQKKKVVHDDNEWDILTT
jgi:hypothetical protein